MRWPARILRWPRRLLLALLGIVRARAGMVSTPPDPREYDLQSGDTVPDDLLPTPVTGPPEPDGDIKPTLSPVKKAKISSFPPGRRKP